MDAQLKALAATSIIDLYYQLCYVRFRDQEGDWKLLLFACHLCGGVLEIFSIMDAQVLRYYFHNFLTFYVKNSPHKVSNISDIQNAADALT